MSPEKSNTHTQIILNECSSTEGWSGFLVEGGWVQSCFLGRPWSAGGRVWWHVTAWGRWEAGGVPYPCAKIMNLCSVKLELDSSSPWSCSLWLVKTLYFIPKAGVAFWFLSDEMVSQGSELMLFSFSHGINSGFFMVALNLSLRFKE